MAFFMLFEVPKSLTRKELENISCDCGEVRKISLRPDKDKNNLQFGQVDFIELKDEKKFISFLKSKNIIYKERTSHQNTKKSICSEKPVAKTSTIHNPSYYFYKDKNYGKDIEEYILEDNHEGLFKIEGAETFKLTTTYPGLLIGSGYNHPKLKDDKNDFQLGFFFDHTTGLPVISGSSIKGAIRSLFPDRKDKYYKEKIALLKEEYGYEVNEHTIKDIFENNAKTIFYDAYITETDGKNKGKIFGSDYITSHHSDEEMGEFKEPNPVKFLKILPGVTFCFQFQATKQQVDLFKKILLDFGVGAKTNVGYGQFRAD